jgi:hypothetical protein
MPPPPPPPPPPWHLTQVFEFCKTCLYKSKVIVLMKENIFEHFQKVWSDLDWGAVVSPLAYDRNFWSEPASTNRCPQNLT